MKNPTKKQEETLREFLHSAVVPLIEDVLVKKLGQAMSYAKEQLATPSKPWVSLTDEEIAEIAAVSALKTPDDIYFARAIEEKLKEKNNGN